MSDSQLRMLQGFALYRDPAVVSANHAVIGVPLGTRLMRMYRLPHGWRLWLSTNDYIYGTYLELYDDGRITRVTTREDEGDEHMAIRPSDETIRNMSHD